MTSGTLNRFPRKRSGNDAARMIATSTTRLCSRIRFPDPAAAGLHQEDSAEDEETPRDRRRLHGFAQDDRGGGERHERLEVQERRGALGLELLERGVPEEVPEPRAADPEKEHRRPAGRGERGVLRPTGSDREDR